MPADARTPHAWHSLDAAAVMEAVGARDGGLDPAEVRARCGAFGPNALPRPPAPSWWLIVPRQFASPLIYILAFAAALSVAIRDWRDAAFILVVLAINALIGSVQEWRAERSSHALQNLLHVRATVVRGGEARETDAEALVPGDLVWLEPGNRVPADLRLLTTSGLEVDESFLTGESVPVEKDAAWRGDPVAPPVDRRNMAYAGSLVVRGRAEGVVVATGASTVVGQLAAEVVGTAGGVPPLLLRMRRFSRVVAVAVLAASAGIALVGIVVHDKPVAEMVLFALALAVAAVPEGLPAAITAALAVAASRMARRGVIVRRLAAVEGLGSCTLIATDKTGTLTCNELTVRQVRLASGEVFDVTGEGFAPVGRVLFHGAPVAADDAPQGLLALARVAALCNEADLHTSDGHWVWRGDPTDIALLSLAHRVGQVREAALALFPQVNQIPFEPERRFAATHHAVGGAVHVFVKGAPERVMAMCRRGTGPDPHAAAESMAAAGYRVLALAEGVATTPVEPGQVPPEPTGLTFLGLVGMVDPLRPGVRDAVARCRDAGIAVCMITGDHPVTALAIAAEIGIAHRPDEVMTGRDLLGASDRRIEDAVGRVRVFARVEPDQKLQLVTAAQRAGHFVAVTGDGVNDAPALRAANIGVAMGAGGTDVARDAASLVISDDNFATIVAGVEEGRVAYDNIRKVVYLLITTGGAQILLVLPAMVMGLPLPLLPVQFLWLNLVTSGIQGVALAFEPNEGDVLHRPPRPPGEPIFNRLMAQRTLVAVAAMGGVGLAAFLWMLDHGWPERDVRNALLLFMVLCTNIQVGNCRSETKSAFALSPLRTPILLVGTLAALLVHLAAMYAPATRETLGVDPVGLGTWATLVPLALVVLVAIEVHKFLWARRRLHAPPSGRHE